MILLMPMIPTPTDTEAGAATASLSGPEIQIEAAEVLRSLIQKVVMLPDRSAPGAMMLKCMARSPRCYCWAIAELGEEG